MPALEPLKQWMCDTCREVIESPEDGYIEWEHESDDAVSSRNYRIVHHYPASPLKPESPDLLNEGCYRIRNASTAALENMLGPGGLARMLSKIDVGAYHSPVPESVPRVKDFRNWAETVRRLQIPFYEEARLYFPLFREDEDGTNEVALYLPETLMHIIEVYRDRAE